MNVKLLKGLKANEFNVLDRWGLVDDYNALFKAGNINIAELIDFVRSFENEKEYSIWVGLDRVLNQISQLINYSENEDLKEKYNQLVIGLLSPIAQKLGRRPVEGEGLF